MKDCRHYLRFYKWVLGPDASNSLVLTRTLNRSKDVTKERFHRAERDLDATGQEASVPSEHTLTCTFVAKETWDFMMSQLDEEEQRFVMLSAQGLSARDIAQQDQGSQSNNSGSLFKVLRVLRKARKAIRLFELVTP